MYKVTIKSVRPNTDDVFYAYDEDLEDYISEKYIATGKLISKERILSENLLQEDCILSFASKEDYQAFKQDKIIAYQERIKMRYNLWHKIACSHNPHNIEITRDLYSLYQH